MQAFFVENHTRMLAHPFDFNRLFVQQRLLQRWSLRIIRSWSGGGVAGSHDERLTEPRSLRILLRDSTPCCPIFELLPKNSRARHFFQGLQAQIRGFFNRMKFVFGPRSSR